MAFDSKLISLLLAVYLFNFSIDGRDAHPDYINEDLAHNDIESILEFALESVLGIENAIHEHDEQDTDHGRFNTQVIFFQQPATCVLEIAGNEGVAVEHHSPRPTLQPGLESLDILSPPPKG